MCNKSTSCSPLCREGVSDLICQIYGQATPSEKRTRKQHYFIGFIVFPVYLPHQGKAILIATSLAFGSGVARPSRKVFIVYQMGRLCGGAHEISGIKAPIFLRGWVGGGGTSGGGVGGVGRVGVVEWGGGGVVVRWVGVGVVGGGGG